VLRAAGGAADHAASERDADGGVEPDDRLRKTALQPVRDGLADHVSGNVDRPVATIAALEGVSGSDEADDADEAAGVADVLHLEGEVAAAAVDEADLSRQ